MQCGQHAGRRAKFLHPIGQIGLAADQADRNIAGQPPLADARVQHRRFAARIGADQQDRVGILDAGDRGVERVEVAARRIEPGTILAAIEVGRAERRHQVLQRQHALGVAQVAGDGTDAIAAHAMQLFGDCSEGFGPARLDQLAVAPHPGSIQPTAPQAVEGEARLVAEPLLVHVLIQSAAGCAALPDRAHRCGCWCRPRPARRCCRPSTIPTTARRTHRAWRSVRRPGKDR